MHDKPIIMNSEVAENLYGYLLLRTDLPSLGRGKSQAHALHAGNHMTYSIWVRPLLEGKAVDPRVEAWHDQGGGFGTAITLGKAGQVTKDVLLRIIEAAEPLGFLGGLVEDKTYPYIVDDEIKPLIRETIHTKPPQRIRDGWLCCREEITAGWLLGDKTELQILLSRFDLAPND